MNNDESFLTLLRRACTRDERAAEELVRGYEAELRRFIRFRFTDPALRRFLDSLDICQSVLASFFVHLQEGGVRATHPRQLASLLFTMAQNKVRDKARQHYSEKHGGNMLDGAPRELANQVRDAQPDPADIVAGRELVLAVRNRLSEADRALLDRWLDGVEWSEISELSGEKPDALRKRLSRSIDRAATELGLIEDKP